MEEIGGGTGQHVVTFAAEFKNLTFWPSDPLAEHVDSIEAWRTYSGLPNVKPATCLDVLHPLWRLQPLRSKPADWFERQFHQ